MSDLLTQLNNKFAIDGSIIIKANNTTDKNHLLYIDIRNKFSSATIQLQGAHLTAWTPNNSEAVIWLSAAATFQENKSIRGGIPVCWPWFGEHSSNSDYPAHGFARTKQWQIDSIEILDSGATQLILSLAKSNMPFTQWPFETRLECIFTIGHTLEVELVTFNHSEKNIVIGEALHSYFNVSDTRNITITGLHECHYLDKLDAFKLKTQSGNIKIQQEIDRVYIATNQDNIIDDPGLNRRIRISKKGSFSTIVWNPWLETANKMADLGTDGYLSMICVESGNAAQDVITIAPKQKHSLSVCYSIEDIILKSD